MHHHTFPINQPTRCNNFSSLLLDIYVQPNSLGRPHAHYQELNNCSSSWLAWPRPTALLSPCSNGKTRGCYCSCCSSWWCALGNPKHVELYINVKSQTWEVVASCWLMYLNCMMMHGLADFKFTTMIFPSHSLLNCKLIIIFYIRFTLHFKKSYIFIRTQNAVEFFFTITILFYHNTCLVSDCL